MTMRELFREFVVTKRRWEAERMRDIHLAWQGVRIYIKSLAKDGFKLPALSTFLDLPKRRQTIGDMEATLRMLSQRTGFPLREVARL